ncbi:Por secretion system C-terminal sorting domain-containing protein [Lishizhenia tianjinensis]|uniref:Por secretion system C-terminal sorting domain-containing protein n=1 Tax=Lishizhenia tianjinensis TaxID=477690 RepID=A0A1I6YAT5_9FLAO|nr:LamG-like jellyroll fold domain-containing protein [Lishizhenia tianjinensis]SFT47391.1 Por secretion system C-terminal sorting domain-containing protein [Lishizhenia tianjinensis]
MKRIITSVLTCLSLGAFAQSTGLEFDGVDDFITTEYDGFTASGSKTVEAWIKATYDSQQRFITDMGGLGSPGSRFSFKINPGDDNIRIEVGGGGLTGTVNVTDNNWHHVAVTYDATASTNKYKLYVDGALDTQGDIATPLNLPVTGGAFMIGTRVDSSSTTMFDGSLDEVRVYNDVRSLVEIQSSMNNELCVFPSSLQAYYKLNEGTAGTSNTAITSITDEITPTSVNTVSTGFSMTGSLSNYITGIVNGPVSTNAITVTSCGDYTSPDNNIYTTSGIYQDTIAGAFCDSVITIDLTIPTFNTNILNTGSALTALETGVTYQWIDCDNGNAVISGETNQTFTPTASGNYAVILTNGSCTETTGCTAFTVGSSSVQFNDAAMNFDGVDDYVQTTYGGISGDAARTIEAWIKTTVDATTTNQQVIVDYGNTGNGQRFTFNVLQNNSIRLEVAGNGVVGSTAVNDGNWHHVAVTYDPADNDTVRLYIDGVEDAKKYISTVNTGTAANVSIGRRQDGVSYFTGDIDEVRIWNVARTPAELLASMNSELCGPQTELMAYYTFNEGSAGADNTGVDPVYDFSGNNNHGTATNMDLTGAASNYVVGAGLTSGMNANFSSVTSCGDYTWAENSMTYTTSGLYTETTTNVNGCDSIIVLNLTVLGADAITETVTACNTYTWATNNQTYTTSGQYVETLTNINGCDSIVTLDLTIGLPTSGTDVITACDSYTWIDGVTYTASNNTATHTIPNALGCDSVVTLDLTINNSDAVTQTVSNCGIYTWAENGQSYFQSGQYTHTLTNINGCDSVITLDLTINLDYTIADNVNACDSYTWPVNGMTYTASGTHTENFTSVGGCDSTRILNLTVNSSTSSTQTEVACATYTWAADGMTYTTSGQYTATLQTVAGCDSVVTLDLTIDNVDNGVTFDYPNGTFIADETSPNATYQWLYCINYSDVNNQTGASFTPQANGDYALEVTNGVCVDTSACFTIDNVGVEQENASTFNVYPNPSNGQFNIAFNEANTGTVVVTDLQGKVISTTDFQAATVVNLVLFNTSKGVYLVTVYGNNGTAVERVIVE